MPVLPISISKEANEALSSYQKEYDRVFGGGFVKTKFIARMIDDNIPAIEEKTRKLKKVD